MATTNQETVSIGEEGQAPVKADTLREMLYQAKSTADDLRNKLASSERMRADQANKMAAHADTMQRLHSLDELVFERSEGVILHVRRPDEAQSYPILIPKAALQTVDPARWDADVIDPAAKAVLAAAERADQWMVDDPDFDDQVRADYHGIQQALGLKGADCAEKAKELVQSVSDLTGKLRSSRTSVGKFESSGKAAKAKVLELQAELKRIRALAGGKFIPEETPEEAQRTTEEIVQEQAEAAAQEAHDTRAEIEKKVAIDLQARRDRTLERRKARAEALKAAEAEKGEDGEAAPV